MLSILIQRRFPILPPGWQSREGIVLFSFFQEWSKGVCFGRQLAAHVRYEQERPNLRLTAASLVVFGNAMSLSRQQPSFHIPSHDASILLMQLSIIWFTPILDLDVLSPTAWKRRLSTSCRTKRQTRVSNCGPSSS
jgi:hypothetical protein